MKFRKKGHKRARGKRDIHSVQNREMGADEELVFYRKYTLNHKSKWQIYTPSLLLYILHAFCFIRTSKFRLRLGKR